MNICLQTFITQTAKCILTIGTIAVPIWLKPLLVAAGISDEFADLISRLSGLVLSGLVLSRLKQGWRWMIHKLKSRGNGTFPSPKGIYTKLLCDREWLCMNFEFEIKKLDAQLKHLQEMRAIYEERVNSHELGLEYTGNRLTAAEATIAELATDLKLLTQNVNTLVTALMKDHQNGNGKK